MSVNGIHHVTAIARSAQENVDFYVGVLGLRLVKRTVNFDDPLTYHLYYGTEIGGAGDDSDVFCVAGCIRRPGGKRAGECDGAVGAQGIARLVAGAV